MPPPRIAATSRVPSAEEAMENQSVLVALVCVHVLPLFVET